LEKEKKNLASSQCYCLDAVINTCRRGQVEFFKYRYMDLDYGLPWVRHASIYLSIYLPDDRVYMEIMIMMSCLTGSSSIPPA
jgi:hypothetical protein